MAEGTAAPQHGDVDALLEYLHASRGFDWSGYKRGSLERRIAHRMGEVGVEDYEHYVDLLQADPEEFQHLFDRVLINVTAFYRDVEAWDRLRGRILLDILAAHPSDQPLRVWSAGCASGEEAYTIAMLLAEAVEADEFARRVKVYATDVDDGALAEARRAIYEPSTIEHLPPDLRDRYLRPYDDGRFIVTPEIRRAVVFGRHDLLSDPPISKVALLACRNTLMYFQAEKQQQILERLHFALEPGGVLFLGRAETLLRHSELFTPVERRHRFFAKHSPPAMRDGLHTLAHHEAPDGRGQVPVELSRLLRAEAFDSNPIAELLVDEDGLLAVANEQALELFGLRGDDLGRPFQDFELSFRPVELRSQIETAKTQKSSLRLTDVLVNDGADTPVWADVVINPVYADDPARELFIGVSIAFIDVSAQKELRDRLEQTAAELKRAHEVLQSTNEELETTNEELQSTNEELETINEELQSTNREFETMNDELRERSSELDEVNAFLESILGSLWGGVAVTDNKLVVRVWNAKAEELWGLRAHEVEGQHLLNLDFGLPVTHLRDPLRRCIDGGTTELHTFEARSRTGAQLSCDVRCAPLTGRDGQIQGTIVLMQVADEDRPSGARQPTTSASERGPT